MTTFGIAGPRSVADERFVADTVLLTLREGDATEFTSECAHGVDTLGVRAAERVKVPLIRLTLPTMRGPYGPRIVIVNRDLRREAEAKGWVVELAPEGRNMSDAYLKRDSLTVARSEILLAFPKTPAEELRSGTWATIRRARKAGIEVRCFPLNGSEPWVEDAKASLF